MHDCGKPTTSIILRVPLCHIGAKACNLHPALSNIGIWRSAASSEPASAAWHVSMLAVVSFWDACGCARSATSSNGWSGHEAFGLHQRMMLLQPVLLCIPIQHAWASRFLGSSGLTRVLGIVDKAPAFCARAPHGF